ncbi:MAG: hypothetical protein F7C81_05415 [Desulfurococcales archaeon]|nr:hypothetical protein [Desulfurococcales archaeon]
MPMCRGYAKLGCGGIAVSGFAAILSLITDNPILPLALAIVLMSSSIITFTSKSWLVAVILPLSMLLISLGALGYTKHLIILALAITAFTLYTSSMEAITASASLIPVSLALSGSNYFNIIAAIAVVLIGLTLIASTRKLHSGIFLAASPIALLGEPLTGFIILASGLAVLLASSGLVDISECPFKSDKYLILLGSIISVGGAFLVFIFGWGGLEASLWLLGFLFLVSGTLAPVELSDRESA